MAELLPVGVRRDGSFYTRIEWASVTEKNPCFWVCNLISDDHERNGGTYGANTTTTADVILSFWGETQTIGKVRIYKNVGITRSVVEELARKINIYVSTTDDPAKIRTDADKITDCEWTLVKSIDIVKEFGWQEATLDAPVDAKYVRIEIDGNFCRLAENGEPGIPWCECSEIKLYPAE